MITMDKIEAVPVVGAAVSLVCAVEDVLQIVYSLAVITIIGVIGSLFSQQLAKDCRENIFHLSTHTILLLERAVNVFTLGLFKYRASQCNL